jgi:CPA2 family monovalent cation:H+ antiporter-2
MFLASRWGWSVGGGLVLGLCLSVASTVVLLKALEERNAVGTPNGRIAVGWLIVEDLVMVLVLVLLPPVAGMLGGHVPEADGSGGNVWLNLAMTLGKIGAFVALAVILGPRVVPWMLRMVARTGSRELFTLAVLAVAIGIAYASAELFGVSYALGAFFAGVVLSESEFSHKAAANSLPLQDAFAVIFFVSVGMLFDPTILVTAPGRVAGVLFLVVAGKSLIAIFLVLALGYPLSTALQSGASLAQVGEFSFILAGLGLSYGLLPADGLSLVLAAAILSITLNPVVFGLAFRLAAKAAADPWWRRHAEERGGKAFARLLDELAAAKAALEAKAAVHKSLGPEELVRRFPLFTGLTPEQREVLVLHFHPIEAQPGERLIRAGDVADAAYFISEGAVEVVVAGRRIRLGAGDFFGEIGLLTDGRRSADVVAVDYSKFLTLSQRDFREFLRRHPGLRERVGEMAAQRGEMNRQIHAEGSRDPAGVG